MKLNKQKKILVNTAFILLVLIMTTAIVGCSQTTHSNNETFTENSNDVQSPTHEQEDSNDEYVPEVAESVIGADNPIEELYKDFEWMLNDEEKENLDLYIELHKKAYSYCSDSYYVETTITSSNYPTKIVKTYVSDGNYRSEETENGELKYLTVYNKDKDILWFYDAANDNTDETKDVTKQGFNYDKVTLGCFYAISDGTVSNKLEESEYNSKPVYKSITEMDDIYIEICFDKETGLELYNLQKVGDEECNTEYRVMPNQTFEDALFVFDN